MSFQKFSIASRSIGDLHMLRKNKTETYEAYIYRMLEIANHADIELDAKI